MPAVLRLIRPTVHPEHVMSKVFTETFVSRLEAVNRVARTLRAMGYGVMQEMLPHDQTERPCIVVVPGSTKQLRPLLELGGGCTTTTLPDGSRQCSIHYQGIRVIWREILRAKEQVR